MKGHFPMVASWLAKLKTSEVGYRLAKGAFWSMAGAVMSRGLMFVASVAVARMLGKVSFGELGMIQSTVVMLGVFAGFGLGMTATKHVAEFRRRDPERVGRIMGLSALVALVVGGMMAVGLFAAAPWLAARTLNAPHLAGVLRIASLILFISALNGAQTGALSGFEAFKLIAGVNLLVGLVSFPVLLAGAWLGGLRGVVWALVINLIFNWLLNHVALRREAGRHGVSFAFERCGQEFPVLWKFSVPAVLSSAMAGGANWACNALLVKQPNGYGEMGVYTAVTMVKQIPEAVQILIMAPLLPMLSEYFGRGDVKSYNKMLSYAFTLSLCIIVPAALIQAAVPALTLLPYGRDYGGSGSVVQWLMLHAVTVGLFYPFGSILSSMNRMWFGFIYNLCWGVTFVALSCLLTPRYGATGLAAAYASAHMLLSLACVTYIYRCEKAFMADTPLAGYALLVLSLLGVCVVAGRYASPWLAGGVGCTAACACVVAVIRVRRGRRAGDAV